MPNRVIKDSILKSKSLASLKPYYQDQFPRWLLMADDWGCFDADIDIVKGVAYPKRRETIKEILKTRTTFYESGHLFVWDDGDREWGFFVNWDRHQFVGSVQYDNKGERLKHRRKTPEPKEQEIQAYLEKYGTLWNKAEHNGMKGSIPIPNPNPKHIYKEFVYLTKEEHEKLTKDLGKEQLDYLITELNNYIGSKGKRYKSHYHTILTWANKNKTDNSKKKDKWNPL